MSDLKKFVTEYMAAYDRTPRADFIKKYPANKIYQVRRELRNHGIELPYWQYPPLKSVDYDEIRAIVNKKPPTKQTVGRPHKRNGLVEVQSVPAAKPEMPATAKRVEAAKKPKPKAISDDAFIQIVSESVNLQAAKDATGLSSQAIHYRIWRIRRDMPDLKFGVGSEFGSAS